MRYTFPLRCWQITTTTIYKEEPRTILPFFSHHLLHLNCSVPTTTMPTTGSRRRNNFRLFNLCFSNYMHPFVPDSPPTTTTSLLHDQHKIDHNRPSLSTATATSSSTMIKSFNTLYDHHTRTSSSYPFKPEPESEPEPEPADFATAFASNRFFFSSPGRSNSIVESSNTDTDFTPASSSSSSLSSMAAAVPAPEDESDGEKKKVVLNGSVAVPTYSPDPYLDFRRSMQEMVEARPELMNDVKSNWEALHELLQCYLALNPKSTHKFILGAFSDLLVTIMSLSSSSSSSSVYSYPPPQNSHLDGGGGGGC